MKTESEIKKEIVKLENILNHIDGILSSEKNQAILESNQQARANLTERFYALKWVLS